MRVCELGWGHEGEQGGRIKETPHPPLTPSQLAGDALLQGSLHKPQVCVGDGLSHGPGHLCPASTGTRLPLPLSPLSFYTLRPVVPSVTV